MDVLEKWKTGELGRKESNLQVPVPKFRRIHNSTTLHLRKPLQIKGIGDMLVLVNLPEFAENSS